MAQGAPLVPLPACQLFAADSNEFSGPETLYCVGPHYAGQIKRITGAQTLGGIVQYFHGMDRAGVEDGLRLFARNARAGQTAPGGQPVPDVNKRVMASLVGLLDVAAAHPECFAHHPHCRNRLSVRDLEEMKRRWGTVCQVQRHARGAREALEEALTPDMVDHIAGQVVERLARHRRSK